jgi:hypothetical protein
LGRRISDFAAHLNAVAKEKYGYRLRRRRLRQGVKILKVKKDRGQCRDQPGEDDGAQRNVPAGATPVLLPARQAVRRDQVFIDVLSAEGQAIVERVGCYPGK